MGERGLAHYSSVETRISIMMGKTNVRACKSVVVAFEKKNSWTMATKRKIYDCYGVLESTAWIWRVLGIFPTTIRYSTGKKKYEMSKFQAVYSCFVYLGCTAHITYGLLTFRKENLNILTGNLLLRNCANLLCLFVSNVWRIFRLKELTASIDMMAMREIILDKMNCQLNYESYAKMVRAYVWITTTVVIFLLAYDVYTSGETLLIKQIQWAVWNIPLVIQTIDLTIFVTLVGLLGSQFRALNEKIENVVKRANASSPKVIVTSDVCAENLRMIAKTHYNICVAGKRINSFFDWDVIINVIIAFMILSTSLYYIFVEVQREGKTDFFHIGTYVQWEIVHSVPIIAIVIICNWTSEKGNLAGKLIHEIRVEKTDSRLYEAVKSFSLQLHHQNLEFTAGGFFPLNPTLLQAIVGSITTYLVILIQFQPKLE